MIASPAQVIVKFLVDMGLAQNGNPSGDWRINTYKMPPTPPDRRITVYNTSPIIEQKLMRDELLIKHYGIMIMIRCEEDPQPGQVKAYAIEDALISDTREAIVVIGLESFTIKNFTVTTGMTPIGQEKDGVRQLFTINGTVTFANP